MPIEAIIFDVEGTLIDCVPHILESWEATLAEAGHTVKRVELQSVSAYTPLRLDQI